MKVLHLAPALGGLVLGQQAMAAVPQDATYQAQISTSIYSPPGATPQSVSIDNSLYNESAYALALPVPQVSAQATSTDLTPVGGASAFMTYDFVINSASSTFVMIDIAALAITGGYGDYAAFAHVDFEGGGAVSLANAQSCENFGGCSPFSQVPPSSSDTKVLYLSTNTDYQILMEASVSLGNYNSAASAYADPVITFDADYSHPADAKIVYSDNLPLATVPSSAPEPASWAMMLAGFGLVGGTMRRRGARPATA